MFQESFPGAVFHAAAGLLLTAVAINVFIFARKTGTTPKNVADEDPETAATPEK